MRISMRVRASIAAVAALAALAAPTDGAAQSPAGATVPTVTSLPGMRSPGSATMLSLAGTLVPTALGIVLMDSDGGNGGVGLGGLLFTYGIYFGPATGYWYAGAPGPAFKGVGIRFGISLATTAAMLGICSGGGCDMLWGDDSALGAALAVGAVGVAAIVYSAIHDIADADNRVRRRNAEVIARHDATRLAIVPIVSPANGGTLGVIGKLGL